MSQIARITYIKPRVWENVHVARLSLHGIANNRSNGGRFGGTFVEMEDGRVRILRTSDLAKLINENSPKPELLFERANTLFRSYGPSHFQLDIAKKVDELLSERRDPLPPVEISVADCLRRIPSVQVYKYSFDRRKAEDEAFIQANHQTMQDFRNGWLGCGTSRTMNHMSQMQDQFDPNQIRNYQQSGYVARVGEAVEINLGENKSICFSDFLAFGVISALYQFHAVPENVRLPQVYQYNQSGTLRLIRAFITLEDQNRARTIQLNIGNLS